MYNGRKYTIEYTSVFAVACFFQRWFYIVSKRASKDISPVENLVRRKILSTMDLED